MFIKRSTPKVSVIIPSYNHERYIRQCVDSVLCQSWRDFEVIVVDDGSTDGTHDILRGFGEKITFIRQENRGTQAARNAGIQASTGEFVALLDSDDAWLPEKLERQMEVFRTNLEVGLVYSQAYLVDSSGERFQDSAVIGSCLTDSLPAFGQLLVWDRIPALTAVFRRSCLDDVGTFDEDLIGAADWDLWLRIAAKWPIACVRQPLALYRVHESNTTNELLKTGQYCREQRRVVEKAFELHGDLVQDPLVWSKAWAQVYLSEVDFHIRAGNIAAASVALARVLSLDPALFRNHAALTRLVAQWVNRRFVNPKSGRECRAFVDRLFAASESLAPSVAHLKRKAFAHTLMDATFEMHQCGDLDAVKSLLPTVLENDPSWVLNRGALAVALRAYVGQQLRRRLAGAREAKNR